MIARLGTLLEEKRAPPGPNGPRWSMTRAVVLLFALIEAWRLIRMPGPLTWPEATFAGTVVFALPIAWLIYRVRTPDIPKVLASFWGRRANAAWYGGYNPGYTRPADLPTDADGGYDEEGEL